MVQRDLSADWRNHLPTQSIFLRGHGLLDLQDLLVRSGGISQTVQDRPSHLRGGGDLEDRQRIVESNRVFAAGSLYTHLCLGPTNILL